MTEDSRLRFKELKLKLYQIDYISYLAKWLQGFVLIAKSAYLEVPTWKWNQLSEHNWRNAKNK